MINIRFELTIRQVLGVVEVAKMIENRGKINYYIYIYRYILQSRSTSVDYSGQGRHGMYVLVYGEVWNGAQTFVRGGYVNKKFRHGVALSCRGPLCVPRLPWSLLSFPLSAPAYFPYIHISFSQPSDQGRL